MLLTEEELYILLAFKWKQMPPLVSMVKIIAYKNYASNGRRALYFASVQMKPNARK